MKITIRKLELHKHKKLSCLYTAKVMYKNIHICDAMYNIKLGGIKLDIVHQELINKVNESCNNSFEDYVKSEIIKRIIQLDNKKFEKDSNCHILYGDPNESNYKIGEKLNKPIHMYSTIEQKQIVKFYIDNVLSPGEVILNKNLKFKIN